MKRFFVVVLALLMSTVAVAADFGGEISGPDTALTIRADVRPSVGPGTAGKYFVGANVPGEGWYFLTPTGWQSWTGGDIPALSSGILAETAISVIKEMDVSSLLGTQIYAGYGVSAEGMLAAGTYSLLYTIGDAVPMGIKVRPNRLPPGCISAADPCWTASMTNGTVRKLKTKITINGSQEVIFLFFQGASGLYDLVYSYEGENFAFNLTGGTASIIDLATGTPNGVIYHVEGSLFCKRVVLSLVPFSISDGAVECPLI